MKLVFISGNLCDGGAQRVISVVASGLAEQGEDVSLLLFSRNEKEYPISEKVKIEALGNSFEAYSRLSLWKRLLLIRKYLKKKKPDIAVGFLEGGYSLYLSSLGMKFKKIASSRINPKYIIGAKGFRAEINKLWFRRADAVVLQTEKQKEFAPKSWLKQCVVVSNPISKQALNGSVLEYSEKCSNFIMVGRLAEQKNYEIALQAFSNLKEKYPQIHLNIFGKGGLEATLKNRIKELDLQDTVSLCGWTQETVTQYCKHDAYLLTSDYEGLPNALMEAMAVGLPCIATDCDTGPSDLIDDGENGFLVPIQNVGLLTEIIEKLILLPAEERAEIGMAAKQKMQKNFNDEIIIQKWNQLFQKILKKDK